MSLFAAAWGFWALAGSGSPAIFYAVPLIISGAIIFTAATSREQNAPISSDEQRRIGRLGGLISGVEVLLIVAAFLILANTGGMSLAAPIVAMIVGLHFLPLASLLSQRLYLVTALLLIASGIGGFLIQNTEQRQLWVCIAAGSVLWLTCGVLALPGLRVRAMRLWH